MHLDRIMGVNINLEGLDDIISELQFMADNIANIIEEELPDAVQPLLNEEKQLVRVKTGATRDSLKTSAVIRTRGLRKIYVGDVDGIRGKIPYYLEYGTSRNRPFPFMRPAAINSEDEVFYRLAKNMERRLSK